VENLSLSPQLLLRLERKLKLTTVLQDQTLGIDVIKIEIFTLAQVIQAKIHKVGLIRLLLDIVLWIIKK
jgi:hypothetical protein